jgi:threonyl-tRNA synthetase
MSATAEMVVLTLPDGKTREVAHGTPAREVVASIGAGLLKASIAVAVDGEIVDLMTPMRKSGAFQVLTDKDPRALGVLRHSGAHILATAVRRLRPEAKIGFGPAIDDGFYYDFEVDKPFTPEDLEAFEAEMAKVSWPTGTEVFRSSAVVIFLIFALAFLLAAFDLFWGFLLHPAKLWSLFTGGGSGL